MSVAIYVFFLSLGIGIGLVAGVMWANAMTMKILGGRK